MRSLSSTLIFAGRLFARGNFNRDSIDEGGVTEIDRKGYALLEIAKSFSSPTWNYQLIKSLE